MQDLAQIEAGNRQTVLAQADRLLHSNGAVLVTYEGLAAMDARGYLTAAEAETDASAFVAAEVGRSARVLTRGSVKTIRH